MSELTRRTMLPWAAMAAIVALIISLGAALPVRADAPDTPVIQAVQTYQTPGTRTVTVYGINHETHSWYVKEEKTVSTCSEPHFIAVWSSVPGATGYAAQYRDADNGGDWQNLRGQKKRGNSVVAGTPPIKVGVNYDIRVAAVKDGATGEYATATAEVEPDVAAPSNLAAVASHQHSDTALLTWQNDPGNSPTYFAVQQRLAGGQWGKSAVHDMAGQANPSIPVFNLQPDVEHQFRIAPQSAFCTYVNWSNTATITLVRKPPIPTVEVEAGHKGSAPVITVTAEENPRTDSYKLRYRQDGAEAYTEVNVSESDAEGGYILESVSANTKYEVGLAAVNSYGTSAYATGNVTTGDVIVVPVEPGFTIASGYRNEKTVITATVGQHAAENESYKLKFRKSGDTDWSTPVAVSRTAAAAGHVMDVDADTGYHVALAGVNGSRVSDYAEKTVRSETAWFVPNVPGFTATAKHNGAQAVITVQVTSPQQGVTAYTLQVQEQDSEDDPSTEELTPAQAGSGYDHPVKHSAVYQVRVSATGKNGTSALSAARTVTTPPPLPKQPEFTAVPGHSNMATIITVTVTSADAQTDEYLITAQVTGDDDTAATTTATKAAATAGVAISVEPDTGYTVSVTGRNSGGTGPEASATVQSLTPFPAQPDATVTAGYDEQKKTILTVTVNSPDEHTNRYTVAHKAAGSEDQATEASVSKTDVKAGYQISVEPSTEYAVTITGHNSHGAGRSAEYTAASLVEVKIPDQPVIAVAPAYDAQKRSVLRVTVSNHDADTTHYAYTLSMTGVDDVTGTAQSGSDSATFSFDIPAASPGTYSVSVKAYIGTEGSDAATGTATAWASYVASVVLSKTSVTLSEGKTYEVYTVSLDQAPAAQGKVTLEITPGNDGAAHVLSQHLGEFNSGNWSAGQVLYAVLPSAPESAGEVEFVHRLLLDGKATGNTATLSVEVSTD